MASKKVFTSLEFQSGAKLLKAKIDPQNATHLSGEDPTFGASAGQLAYGDDANLYLGVGAEWKKLMRVGQPISTASVLTSTLDSNSGAAPPFVVASSDKVVNLNADLLDGATADNAAGGNLTIPVRDANNLFHVGTPTADTHVSNKGYVDTAVQGLDHKESVRLATTSNLSGTLSGTTFTGSGGGVLPLDTINIVAGNRVLVKNQSTVAQNGIYTVTNPGSSGVAFILERATDGDGTDLNDGAFVFVEEGDTQVNSSWVLNGTTWTQFSGAGQIAVTSNGAVAAPLTKSGDTIDFRYSANAFSTTGLNKVAQGDFDLGLNNSVAPSGNNGTWYTNSGWEITANSGVATATGTADNYIYQNVGLSAGKTYRYSFAWARTSGTSLKIQYANSSAYVDIAEITATGSGTETGEFTTGATDSHLYFLANGSWAGTIDNIVVQEVALTVKSGGIDTVHLADDAVDADKLDDSATFTMGGLTVNGTAQVFSTNSPATLEIKGGTAWESSGASEGTNGNEHGRLDFKTSDSSVTNPAVTGRISSVIENPNSAFNGLAFSTFDQTASDRLTKQMQLTYQGKLALGKDAVEALITTPTASGTLHVSTARYGSELITGDNSTFTSGLGSWATGNNWNSQTHSNGQMVLSSTATNNRCLLDVGLVAGRRYRFTYDASGITGTVTLRCWVTSYVTLGTFVAGTAQTIEFTAPASTLSIIYIGAAASGDAITLDNLFLKEDYLSTNGTISVDSNADDLVITNGASGADAGMSIISANDRYSKIFFGDKDDADSGKIYYDNNSAGHAMSFATAGTLGLTIDSSQNVYIPTGGLGIGMAATVPLDVKNTASDSYAVHIKASGTSHDLVGIFEEDDGRGVLNVRNDAGTANINLDSDDVSWFNGGNLAIGGTTAATKLEVNTAPNSDAITLRASTASSLGQTTGIRFQYNAAVPAAIRTSMVSTNSGAADLGFFTASDGTAGNLTNRFEISSTGTQDHKANSIVNSSTVQGLQDSACYACNLNSGIGGTGHIRLTDSGGAGLNTWAGATTIAMWIKPNGVPTLWDGLYSDANSSGGASFHFAASGILRLASDSGSPTVSSTTAVTANEWNHVVVSYDGTDATFYINGVDAGGGGAWSQDAAGTVDVAIGQYYGGANGSQYKFDGYIRQVQHFPSALTAGDVRKLYSGENPKKNLNVELLTTTADRDFSSDSGNWDDSSAAWTIGSGVATFNNSTGSNQYLKFTGVFTVGKYYKITGAVTGDGLNVYVGNNNTAATLNSTTPILVKKATQADLWISASNTGVGTLDDISVQEVETLVDFNSQSASSTKWNNEAIPSLYHGTLQGGVTLSQGNTYWGNIKQVGSDVEHTGTLNLTGTDAVINATGGHLKLHYDSDSNAAVADRSLKIYNRDALAFEVDGNSNAHLYAGRLGVGGSALTTAQLYTTTTLANIARFDTSHATEGRVIINTNGASADSLLSFMSEGSTKWSMGNNAGDSDKFHIGTNAGAFNGNEKFTIDRTSGNCGIGTTLPQGELSIHGTSPELWLTHNVDDQGDLFIRFGHRATPANGYIKTAILSENSGTSHGRGNLHFLQNSTLDSSNATVGDAVLTLNNDGTHNHQGNRIVNSQTLNDSHRTAEPSLRFSGGTTNGGTSDYVDIGTTTNYGPKATVAVWVKFNKLDAATNGREAIVASKYWADDNFSLQLHDTDRILFTGGSAKYVGWSTDTGHLKTNTWHHLCLVYDKTQTTDAAATPLTNRVKLYIDGVLRTPIAYDGDFSAVDLKTDDGLKLGNTNNSGAQYCHDGEIRDVRIHNRALDSDEVAAAYNGNSTPFEYADASTADLIGANYGGSGTTWTGASGTTPPTGWTSGGTSPVFTIDSGTLKITAGTGNAWIKPTFNTTSGKRYRLEFRYVNTTGHVAQYSIDGSNFIDLANSTSWSSFSVEFDGTGSQPVHLVAKTTGHIVWFDDAKIYEIGEVAAYTPQSIDCSTKLAADYKWLDTTSNANHGTITGATSVGDNDHRGVLVVKGRSEHGDSDHNHSGCLYVGGQITSYAGRLDYNQGGYTELTLDNTNNHTSAKTSFGMKTAGTRLPVLELLGDGTVKATSGTSGNLRQVARTATDTIQGDGTAVAFEVVHNLGTKFVTVSVREKDNGAGQEYAYVDTEIRGGAWADSNGALEGVQANTEESQITVIFSSAPANGKDYYVTCIGA